MEKKPGEYRMGRCTVWTAIENGLWHMSISVYRQPKVLPAYKEIKKARYLYCPGDIMMAEMFPPKEEFVSVGEVRHLWEIERKPDNNQ